MNIVINAVLYHEKPRGVGRYFNNLLPELAKIDHENEYYIFYGKWMDAYEFLKVEQSNIHFVCLDIPRNKIVRNLYLAIVLQLKIKKYKPDVYHQIDTSPILLKTCPTISTIHDLAEFEVPEKYSKFQSMSRKLYVRGQMKLSDLIITVSEYSKNDIIRRFHLPKEEVIVVPESSSSNLQPSKIKPEHEKYILFVGEIERTKNLGIIIEAFEMLNEEVKDTFSIHVVGRKGNDYENCKKVIERTGLEDKVIFHDYVDDEELLALYEKAYVFVFASLFEGFGLPVLEAMTLGVPVICSNATSIPEVGGYAVLTFNPKDKMELKGKLEQIISCPELREKLIESGLQRAAEFTPRVCAEKTLEVYEKLRIRNE